MGFKDKPFTKRMRVIQCLALISNLVLICFAVILFALGLKSGENADLEGEFLRDIGVNWK